ncbi:Z1 domain-containing protein [Opitutales bacterium]|nr:Z1 domain-containing protein [Opitutales bacterium]
MKEAAELAQVMISNHEGVITSDIIASKVDELLQMPTYGNTCSRSELIKELDSRFSTWVPDHKIIYDDDDHTPWLPEKKGEIEWDFWNRYKIYLAKKLPPDPLNKLDTITDDILGHLHEPQLEGSWDRRGLVAGSVQSGKTGNYTGLICKAADAGYKVIIVLAGMHNNLRSQTQIRIDEGFLGYDLDGGKFTAVGVGLINPSVQAITGTSRDDKGDFSIKIARQFGVKPGETPIIFVVKKSVPILKRLLTYIQGSADVNDTETGRRFHSEAPLLVIDDEADQASVDTKRRAIVDGEPDPEHCPTRINSLIRQLLSSFSKKAYVGYTATPFANIFIPSYEKFETVLEGADLFPKSFILNIPTPSNYIGPDKVFGVEADEDIGIKQVAPLPITRVITDYAVARDSNVDPDLGGIIDEGETEGWMPPRLVDSTQHIPLHEEQDTIPPSLEVAIRAFILATAVRRIREEDNVHNSMLIHVVRLKDVQGRVKIQVEEALTRIKNRLRNGDGDTKPTIIEELEEIWIKDFIPTTGNKAFEEDPFNSELKLPNWPEVEKILWKITSSIQIMTVNGTARDALTYDNHKVNGLNVIAIGGDKLSRGLTLEGLTVSYFLRASKMYDTLMQMGRWFGYRSSYIDVCRLYTTEGLLEWFAHLAVADGELRKEFDYMFASESNPRKYGLRVQSHPAMLVTSRVKMRHGERMQLSYAGDISETIIFDSSGGQINRNLRRTESWLQSLGKAVDGSNIATSYKWTHIKPEKICEFLSLYKTHEEAFRVRTNLLSNYIKKQNDKVGELTNWTVVLISKATRDKKNIYDMSGIGEVGFIKRSNTSSDKKNKYTIKRLVSPTDEARDLNEPENTRAIQMTIKRWEDSTDQRKSPNKPTRAGGKEIRTVRSQKNGLLCIYPLNPAEAKEDCKLPIMGISLSFPTSNNAEDISYVVNSIFQEEDDWDEN